MRVRRNTTANNTVTEKPAYMTILPPPYMDRMIRNTLVVDANNMTMEVMAVSTNLERMIFVAVLPSTERVWR